MDLDPLNKIESLFHEALSLDFNERSSFLERRCSGDHSLKEEVEALLVMYEETKTRHPPRPAWKRFLESNETASKNVDLEPDPDLPFERLGDYRLIRCLGEGGMGRVYLAVQESLGRRVAIKVIRPERKGVFESESRFLREAEAVSKLDHPGIVTIFGSGEEQGVSYFAMELLQGTGLDQLLLDAASRSERIPIRKILGWIQESAEALHAAHAADIIHRDVKPSNIRINLEGKAILMDFGIARQMNLTTLTLTGEFRGTPHYASPEQVESKGRIDTRTDIYSLGVTLYVAVTGRVPFVGETTEQVFHQILNSDPLPPRQLNPSISKSLETVILAAMEKDPDRRYRNMADFSEDLRRLLNNETIRIKPPGLLTKAWKKIRKKPVLTSVLGMVFLSLTSFYLYVVLWSYPLIQEERDNAVTERERAEKESNRTRAVNNFLATILTSPIPSKKGSEVKVVDVLDTAILNINRVFRDQPELAAWIHGTIGHSYYCLGQFSQAEIQHRTAFELQLRFLGEDNPDTLTSMNNLGVDLRELDRLPEAELLCREVYERRIRLLDDGHLDTLTTITDLATALSKLNRYSEAEELLHQGLEAGLKVHGNDQLEILYLKNSLAILLYKQNKLQEAEALFRDNFEVQKRVLGKDSVETMNFMHNYASILDDLNKDAEAEELFRELLDIKYRILTKNHPKTVDTMNNYGLLLQELGKFSEAEPYLIHVVEICLRDLGDDNTKTTVAQKNLAGIYIDLGKFKRAEEILDKVIEKLRNTSGMGDPGTWSAMNMKAVVKKNQGKLIEAKKLYAEIIEHAEKTLSYDNPKRTIYHQNYGVCLRQLKEYEESEVQLLAAFKGHKAVFGEDSRQAQSTLKSLVKLYTAWDKPDKSAKYRAMRKPGN